MNFLALIHSVLLKPLFNTWDRINGAPAQRPLQHYALRPRAIDATNKVAARAVSTRTNGPKTPQTPALRVVRVVDSSQGLNTVGRMVISGRMADVCAELDRLAACEAAG